MNEFNRLSQSTWALVVILLSLLIYSGLTTQSVMEQRDSAYAQIKEYQKLISLQNDKILEQKDTIIKLRATQVSYHTPESYGIEHYANPITLEEGLEIVAEFRWIHQDLLNNIQKGMTYAFTDEAWEQKVLERYDQLRELLR